MSAAAASISLPASSTSALAKWPSLAPPVVPALTAAQSSAIATIDARAAAAWPAGTAAGAGGGAGGDTDLAAWLSETRAAYRCLYTAEWAVDKAWRNLEQTVAWRRATLTPRLSCARCAADASAHCFVRVGLDNWRRPIVYFSPARCRETDATATIAHAAAEMEVAFAAPDCAPQWVFVLDLRGVGLFSGYDKGVLRQLIDVFTLHYPERLGAMLLIDLGVVLSALFSVIKGLMDPQTVRKLTNLRARDINDVAAALCGASSPVAEWLVRAVEGEPKPGNLPPLPPGAPPAVHALAARGLTLTDIIARTKAGDTFPEVPR